MTIKKFDDGFYGSADVHAISEATYTTVLSIDTTAFGANRAMGLRARGVYRGDTGGSTAYAGYAETCASWDEAWGSVIGNISGNGDSFGHVGSVAGLSLIVIKFVQNGTNIDVKVSGLDTDPYKWFVAVKTLVYETG
jgi:hypothetical protein